MGARIFPVPLECAARGTEVSVEEVRAPERVRQAEAHEVTVMVRSRTAVSARVTLLRDAVPVAARVEQLAPGENAVQFTGSVSRAGTARVGRAGGGAGRRHSAEQPQPPVRGGERRAAGAVRLQARQGLAVPPGRAVRAGHLRRLQARDGACPGTLAGYLPYDALILDNVPGYGISTEKMETIARYVRDAGGGLLMAGGDSSFGAGGYYKTPIERVLPVDMDAKSQVQVPGLSLVLVVDKSGSMGGTVPRVRRSSTW